MSSRIFLVLSLIFSLIQGPFLPLVFAEGMLIVFYLWSNNFDKNFVWPFIAGLIFDLIQDQTLGLTSLIFLFTSLFLKQMRGNLPLHRSWILAFVSILVTLIRSQIVLGVVPVVSLIVLYSLSFILYSAVWGGRRDIRIG